MQKVLLERDDKPEQWDFVIPEHYAWEWGYNDNSTLDIYMHHSCIHDSKKRDILLGTIVIPVSPFRSGAIIVKMVSTLI
jgi:hypothetical protein